MRLSNGLFTLQLIDRIILEASTESWLCIIIMINLYWLLSINMLATLLLKLVEQFVVGSHMFYNFIVIENYIFS